MEETQQQQGLRRSLKARHMNMIAIGGAIGTGLFVAGGETVSSAGPGGALVAYALIGIMVYFLMTGLGEMASYLPVSGSFETYANRYVDKSLGFALGWNYWFNWAITVAAELVAGALIMKYWFPDVPAAIWSGLFLIILFVLNYLSTRSYGESEFIFAGIKVLTVLVFLFAGTLLILGLGPEPSPGFTNWTIGEAPFVGGFTAMLGIFMVAGFSFQGTEMIGIAAGESEDPRSVCEHYYSLISQYREIHWVFMVSRSWYSQAVELLMCPTATLLSDVEPIENLVKTVRSGNTHAERISAMLTSPAMNETHDFSYRSVILTLSERKVLRLLGKGWGINQIASLLKKSNKTISAQKNSAMRRLAIHSNAEMYAWINSAQGARELNLPSVYGDAAEWNTAELRREMSHS